LFDGLFIVCVIAVLQDIAPVSMRKTEINIKLKLCILMSRLEFSAEQLRHPDLYLDDPCLSAGRFKLLPA
jgi:hypothetical protein